MILFRNIRKVRGLSRNCSGIRDLKRVNLATFNLSSSGECSCIHKRDAWGFCQVGGQVLVRGWGGIRNQFQG